MIFDGFEPLPSAPHCHDEHDLALPLNSALEAAPASALTLSSEPTASIKDGRSDATSGAVIPTAIELNTSPALHETHDSKESDSSPDSEPFAPLPIKSDWASIMVFTTAGIFQHSPFGDITESLKSLSLSGEP